MAIFTAQSNTYEGRYLKLTITQAQNIGANTSTLTWKLECLGGEHSYYSVYPTTVKINNEQVYYKGTTTWSTKVFPAARDSVSGSITVAHNSDGTLSVPVYFYTGIYSSSSQKDYGGTFTLDANPRAATIVSAPNFNDEENPVLTYNNTAGNYADALQAAISLTGSTDDIVYRDISKTGSSYTFTLTEAERNVLRAATTTSNSRTVHFYLKTVIGGNTFWNSVARTLTIVNAAPTLAPTVQDTGGTSVDLTGNAGTMIKGFNYMVATANATALKGATISSYRISCGGIHIAAASGPFSNTESNVFEFSATDSRGNTTTKTITVPMIDYVKLTCNIDGKINLSDADSTKADITFTISGNYYNGSFGAKNNSLTLAYTISSGTGAMSYYQLEIPASAFSGNTYKITHTITDLDYQNSYVVIGEATDVVTGKISSISKTLKAVPVFDWGESDFNFNVPVTMMGTPLDYIVEQGASGSWYYRKWSSGIAELWGWCETEYQDGTYCSSYQQFPITLTTWIAAIGTVNGFSSNENEYLSVNAKIECFTYGCNVWVHSDYSAFVSSDTPAVSIHVIGRYK